MMILGGSDRSWTAWREGRDGSVPDVYVRVVPRSAGPVVRGHPGYVGGLDLQLLPAGSYFRGGYGGRVRIDRGGSGSKTCLYTPEAPVVMVPALWSIVVSATRHPRVGLALSGGGFRATAFGLGALRALHDRNVLADVEVVSGVSGGSLLTAMWAYGPGDFEEFDDTVTS
jgi:Patatin-like phospholipase